MVFRGDFWVCERDQATKAVARGQCPKRPRRHGSPRCMKRRRREAANRRGALRGVGIGSRSPSHKILASHLKHPARISTSDTFLVMRFRLHAQSRRANWFAGPSFQRPTACLARLLVGRLPRSCGVEEIEHNQGPNNLRCASWREWLCKLNA